MNKEILKRTEKILYKYYYHIKTIEKLKNQVVILWKQKEDIEKDIQNSNITLEGGIRSVSYGEKVQTSFDSTSYAEKEAIRAIEKLEKELVYKNQRILKLHTRIRDIEVNIGDINYNINLLEEEDRKFLRYKYGDNKSIEQISIIFNMSRATAYRKKDNLINHMASLIGILK
ncbi:putative DNA-binding protein YlxM (UPF0122 family) [Clostridium tetanomorphum]|uniref:Uncharacterized protein n=1 Tax=Clostridium tetanomorphum TaxID=1553 RepID=A0A923EA20_CLOTT|nr:hypothetical protein [Clostridium tetanomorphum]KAJ51082.1 hypothetical protein CTM_14388 [Clostridium tetanomorphum DSM 665]MBC2398002.1 hypothetical protein [Clostridium tetanomorphum]MBP1864491.1 putative DNA-binding protein YlxM (UPF0122 family) [Clostridium tetanomorphum]NRS82978.1 putative DNA-binding protein YlxM (UPF0122 family) [Clostridium tetanomorphum]NRZ98926.1 putative DNA-binding protein YlxM (UPF0122 family) [Clostridium tetanomorphum]